MAELPVDPKREKMRLDLDAAPLARPRRDHRADS